MAVVRVRIPVARPLRRVGLPRSELPGLGDPRGGPNHAGGGAADQRDHVPASWYRLAPDDGVVLRVRTSVPGCRLRRRTAGVPVAPARAAAPIGAGPRIPAPAELKALSQTPSRRALIRSIAAIRWAAMAAISVVRRRTKAEPA